MTKDQVFEKQAMEFLAEHYVKIIASKEVRELAKWLLRQKTLYMNQKRRALLKVLAK